MDLNFLDFERPIAELEAKIDELRFVGDDSVVNLTEEIARLRSKSESLTRSIFSNLSAWQIAQLARHPQRPHSSDYIQRIFSNFEELHEHNFGMPKPEGYRKALRLMEMAARFRLPVVTLIDTPGAYPGVGAEERGQSEAIARNLAEMAELRTPIVSAVIGEGGSGGALAIGVADRLVMLQYSIYSVISPEGCASILWKSADRAEDAAEAMGITADRLRQLKLVDEVLKEPLGGAHRDIDATAQVLKNALIAHLDGLTRLSLDELLDARYQKLMSFGRYKED
jgi:acetyl-CoA carboxylase carboxyl transferase subunit alpha